MRRLLLAALIAFVPLTGFAQQTVSPSGRVVVPSVEDSVKFMGMTSDQALAVGLGVLAGAIGLHILLGGGAATLVGAMAGALIGQWWFEHKTSPGGEGGLGYTVSYPSQN